MINDISTPVIQARGLTKTYPGTHALRGASLDVARNEAVAIMGPSGSGKTTLLHCLAGLVEPDDGSVTLDPGDGPAVNVEALSRTGRARLRRGSFGFVFQQGLLMPELTAVENIAVGGMLAGMKRPRAMANAMQWLDRLMLADHAHKRIGQLSGGQAQRVAIARSQITQPQVTFADEPTGALDSQTSDEVMSLLLTATTGAGRALVLVTHDQTVADRAHRVVQMADGTVLDGSPTAAGIPEGRSA